MLKTRNLTVKTKADKLILNNISVEIPPGRITCFLGPSGSGKTTLFRSIVQLQPSYGGSISIDGKEASTMSSHEMSTHVGYVFQQFNLFPHLTVLQNCIQPLVVVQKKSLDQARDIALEQLEFLGMSGTQSSYPHQLSGGQQQRVAIARALCISPQTLLLDEPTASLDPFNTQIVQDLVKKLSLSGIGIGIATHDTEFVKGILDRIYFIDQGTVTESVDMSIEQAYQEKCPKITRFLF